MRKRVAVPAVGVGIGLAVFAGVNRVFRKEMLEPHLGVEAASFLTVLANCGAVLVATLLLVGTVRRGFSRKELLQIGTSWAVLSAFSEMVFGDLQLASGREVWFRAPLFGLVLFAEAFLPLFFGALRKRIDRAHPVGRT